MAFMHSPKAVLLWETRFSRVCFICTQGSTEESGPENQREEEGVQWAAANPPFFSPKISLWVLSRAAPSLAVLAGRAPAGRGASHPACLGPMQWSWGHAAVPMAGSTFCWQALACTAPFRTGSGQLLAGIRGLQGKWRAAAVCASPAGSSQPTGSRAGWHGQALPASCPPSPAQLTGQSGRQRLIEQISCTQGWGA